MISLKWESLFWSRYRILPPKQTDISVLHPALPPQTAAAERKVRNKVLLLTSGSRRTLQYFTPFLNLRERETSCEKTLKQRDAKRQGNCLAASCSLWNPRQMLTCSSNKFRLFATSLPKEARHEQFVTPLLSNAVTPLLPSHVPVHTLLPFFPPPAASTSPTCSQCLNTQYKKLSIRQGRFYMTLSRKNVKADGITKCLTVG